MDLIVNDTLMTSLSTSHHHYQIHHINALTRNTHTHTHILHDRLSFVLRVSLFLPLVSPMSLIVIWQGDQIEAIFERVNQSQNYFGLCSFIKSLITTRWVHVSECSF